jgi:hypothetical protein
MLSAWSSLPPVATSKELSLERSRGYLAEGQARPQKRITAEYDYVNEEGELLYQVVRYDPKEAAALLR